MALFSNLVAFREKKADCHYLHVDIALYF
jgi:hypothetical protein